MILGVQTADTRVSGGRGNSSQHHSMGEEGWGISWGLGVSRWWTLTQEELLVPLNVGIFQF